MPKQNKKSLTSIAKKFGFRIKDMVKRTGISRSTISRHFNGVSSPNIDQRAAYEKVLKMPWDKFIADVPDDGMDPNVDPYSEMEDIDAPAFNLAVAAGQWIEIDGEENACNERDMRSGRFKIRIRGDSMSPKYNDGDTVIFKCIKIGEDAVHIGKNYYIQREDGMATFKSASAVQDGVLVLSAINVAQYPKPLRVELANIARAAIALGKFIGD